MTYPPQSPPPNQYGSAPGPGPGGPGPQPGAPADFATQWGIKENPGRPKKLNQLTQLLWAYFGVTVLLALFAIVATATIPFFGGFIIASSIVGLIFHGLSIVIVWFITKEKLGAFGAQDPRMPLYIGLGILGFFALGGFFGGFGFGWFVIFGVLLGLARIAAVGAAFYLVTQPEVEHWLKSRPGNQRKPPVPPQGGYPQQGPGHPQQGYPQGYPQQGPGYQQPQPPAAGQQIPPGYPNEM